MALSTDKARQSAVETRERAFDTIAANVTIFSGAIVSMDSAGNCRPGRANATDRVVGTAKARVASQTSAGAPAGGAKVEVEGGIKRIRNSGGADAITNAHRGRNCFVVDDETVALTSLGGTRPRAGTVHSVTSKGVYVDFDAAPNLTVVVGPLRMTDVSAASDSAAGFAPINGVVTEVWGVLGGAITVADSVVTPKIAGVSVTGTMTVPFTGSGADVRSLMHPSGANRVSKGQKLIASTGGESTTTATMDFYFEIEAD